MNFGISETQYELIINCIRQLPEIERVIIFGSRALGNWKPASDLDLLLVGDNVSPSTVVRLRGRLNEDAPLPFYFDVLNANDALPRELREHIDQHGIVFWPKTSEGDVRR